MIPVAERVNLGPIAWFACKRIVTILRMQGKVIRAGFGAGVDCWASADWFGIDHTVANDAKLTATLAHQNITAGKKSHAEGAVEGLGHHAYFDLVLLSGIDNE